MGRLNLFIFSLCTGLIIGLCVVLFPESMSSGPGGFIGRLLDKPSDVIKAQTELERVKFQHIEKIELLKLATRPRVPALAWVLMLLLLAVCVALAVMMMIEKERSSYFAFRINQLLSDQGADRKAIAQNERRFLSSGKEVIKC